jgi:hypothetical protein
VLGGRRVSQPAVIEVAEAEQGDGLCAQIALGLGGA